jgi:Flp pilus assembly protein TadD
MVAVALLALAWLALGIRALDLESEGTASALRDARLLSVDKEPLVNEGLALYKAGRRDEGLAVTRRVVAEEPDNLQGWLALSYLYTASDDSRRATRALRQARALNPFIRQNATGP